MSSLQVRYAGVVVAQGEPARAPDGVHLFLPVAEPLPVGTPVELLEGAAKARPARVERVVEATEGGGKPGRDSSRDAGKDGMKDGTSALGIGMELRYMDVVAAPVVMLFREPGARPPTPVPPPPATEAPGVVPSKRARAALLMAALGVRRGGSEADGTGPAATPLVNGEAPASGEPAAAAPETSQEVPADDSYESDAVGSDAAVSGEVEAEPGTGPSASGGNGASTGGDATGRKKRKRRR